MAEVIPPQRQPSRYRARRPTGPTTQPVKVDTMTDEERMMATRSMSRYRKARPTVVPAQLEIAAESRKSLDAGQGQSEVVAAAARVIEANENLVFLPSLRRGPEEQYAPVVVASPTAKSPTSPVREFFGFFRRKSSKNLDRATKAAIEQVPVPQPPPPTVPVQRKSAEREVLVTQEMCLNGQGLDAPVSAINAGERRVLVRCKDSSISLPVQPTTSCVELIYSAANCLAQSIDPQDSTLVESLPELGLSRSVRKYEHVRDILNSWDRDTQHGLIVEPAGSEELSALDVKFVPKKAPAEQSAYLYHCQKPGKWDKVWVTIRSDGQVLMRKKQSTVKEKDIHRVSHLSDSDVYRLTRTLERQLRRPKKANVCFAVKSQQKGSMFQDKSSYIHYFCTDDQRLGDDFSAAVRDWRSWYLVNMMGEGARPSTAKRPITAKKDDIVLDVEDRYQIGTFEPLMSASDMDFRKSLSPDVPPIFPPVPAVRQSSDEARAGRKKSTKGYYPPTAMPTNRGSGDRSSEHRNSQSSLTQTGPKNDEEENTFAPLGLLGRTYSQRQSAMKEREANAKRDSGAFVSGPNLINRMSTEISGGGYNPSGGLSRSSSMVSKRNSAGQGLATSKTLLSFGFAELETIKDPPQFSRKGRGYAQLDDAPLVESARHVDTSVVGPYSTTSPVGRSSLDQRRGAQKSTAHIVNPFRDDIHRREDAFTKGPTLLSSHPTLRNKDGAPVGRARSGTAGRNNGPGVPSNGPLLDLSDKPLFADGSLLSRV